MTRRKYPKDFICPLRARQPGLINPLRASSGTDELFNGSVPVCYRQRVIDPLPQGTP